MTEEEINKFVHILNPGYDAAKVFYHHDLSDTLLEDVPESPYLWDVLFQWSETPQGVNFWYRACALPNGQEEKEAKAYLRTVVARVRGIDKKEEDFL